MELPVYFFLFFALFSADQLYIFIRASQICSKGSVEGSRAYHRNFFLKSFLLSTTRHVCFFIMSGVLTKFSKQYILQFIHIIQSTLKLTLLFVTREAPFLLKWDKRMADSIRPRAPFLLNQSLPVECISCNVRVCVCVSLCLCHTSQ